MAWKRQVSQNIQDLTQVLKFLAKRAGNLGKSFYRTEAEAGRR